MAIEKLSDSEVNLTQESLKETRDKINEIIDLLNGLNLEILGTRMIETIDKMVMAIELLPTENTKAD